ncbi:MAG TPA: phage holin family protein [Kofleriaceae bacterium]
MEPEEPPPESEPSFSELFADFASEVGTLVRQEVLLAANEMGEKARYAGRNAILVGVGALLGAVSLLVFAGFLVLALGSVLPMWTSALVIAVVIGGAGYAVFRRGVTALRSIELLPTETFASLKDDGTWAKEQIEATRDQMATTIGEVRRRLQPPPPKMPRRPLPKRKKPT